MSIEGGQDSDKGTHRKRKDWLLYRGGKGILKVMNGETSKVIKRKSEKEIKKTLEIYKKWICFIMTISFKFTCMISCTLILRQYQRRNNFQILKHFLILQVKVNSWNSPRTLDWIQLHYLRKLWVRYKLWWNINKKAENLPKTFAITF